jgi:hypothetical protein
MPSRAGNLVLRVRSSCLSTTYVLLRSAEIYVQDVDDGTSEDASLPNVDPRTARPASHDSIGTCRNAANVPTSHPRTP